MAEPGAKSDFPDLRTGEEDHRRGLLIIGCRSLQRLGQNLFQFTFGNGKRIDLNLTGEEAHRIVVELRDQVLKQSHARKRVADFAEAYGWR